MASLIDRGVDGMITDYPDRLRAVMAPSDLRLPDADRVAVRRRGPSRRRAAPAGEHAPGVPRTRLQPARRHARARHGRDEGRRARRARTTARSTERTARTARPGDRSIRTRQADPRPDAGADQDARLRPHAIPSFPDQVAQPGAQMPTLQEVFDLVTAQRATARSASTSRRRSARCVERHRAVRRVHAQARARDRAQPPGAIGR